VLPFGQGIMRFNRMAVIGALNAAGMKLVAAGELAQSLATLETGQTEDSGAWSRLPDLAHKHKIDLVAQSKALRFPFPGNDYWVHQF
jgi:hypothetical protein